ncbi:hypothetical protein KUV57_13090 [Epibacterium sp. DP7N7-1]|nr:hypothetical protein [Epibacterium sp. DP7N7-1]
MVEIVPIPAETTNLPAIAWDVIRKDWLQSGGISYLHHALWHLGCGRTDLKGVEQLFGPIDADSEAIKTLSQKVQDSLTATTKDDAS